MGEENNLESVWDIKGFDAEKELELLRKKRESQNLSSLEKDMNLDLKSSKDLVKPKTKLPLSEGLDFGINTFKTLSTDSKSSSESNANTLNLAVSGAKLGAKIGGPLGAAAGAVGGAIIGVIDSSKDAKKRIKKEHENYINGYMLKKTQREEEQRILDGQKSLKRLELLRKSQLGYL